MLHILRKLAGTATLASALAASAAGITAGTIGAAGIIAGPATAASAATCSTSNAYSHTVTSRGTNTYTWTHKVACGRNYQKWTHRETFSYTGAHSDAQTYRNELRYPHFWQQEILNSWSARNTHTYRVTVTAG